MNKTFIFAHRGSKGTHPENTLEAFTEAIRIGVEGIELDVHLTKDGELAVIHDETVDRTSNGTGYVRDMTMAELKKLDAGSWFSEEFSQSVIPTLAEVLSLLKDTNIKLNVEIKSDIIPYEGIEEKVLQTLENYSYKDKAIISSFNHYSVKKVHELDPNVETAVLFMEVLYAPWEYARSIGASALHVYLPVAFTEMSREAKRYNYPVRVFTVNDKVHIKQLSELQLDTIMTDFPEMALQIRNEI